jgi:hypothetical protein
MSDYTPAERAIMDARCPNYFEEVGCDGLDGCSECIAAVRRAAITEAVDRLTFDQLFELWRDMDRAKLADCREILRRALTEGT